MKTRFHFSTANNGSEYSSSISSIMGYADDAQNNCSPQEICEEHQSIQSLQHSHTHQDLMTTEQLQQELINDIIVNDLVIIDGSCLQHTTESNEDGQINENYFIEHCHESDAASNAAINESSNEVSLIILTCQYSRMTFYRFLRRFSSKVTFNCAAETS